MGAYPGLTTKALPKEGGKKGLSKPEKAPVTWVAITGEVNVATGLDELELVMAGKEGNVETNADNLNVPEEAVGELATTIAWPELTLVLSAGIFTNPRNDGRERIFKGVGHGHHNLAGHRCGRY